VAEDNNDPAIEAYLQTITDIDIIHTKQDDIGIRKSRSQNNAIIQSTGDYLIFIDADCIPYRSFISSHAKLAEKGCVLSGRRVNTGPKVSSLIRDRKIKSSTLERYFIASIPALLIDGTTHIGQGLFFDPDGYIYKNIISRRAKTNTNILGCNFSCFKNDMLAINGFDESYGQLALPDDTDIQWRFKAYGLRLKSCKMAANVFHLHHKIKTVDIDAEEAALMNKKMNEKKSRGDYEADIGISSHDPI
jgi:cellulose synthase/poly-beta-1,6-N-acetylglucosamine synthase-like glycosyltransferase